MSDATDGAPFIPLSEPVLQGREWDYVRECLDTAWVSSGGPFVTRFEREVAEYVGAKHAVATSTGTAALHTALLVAGVRPGDEVLVSTLTFIASANAIRYAGAVPVFIDAEPRHWQMDSDLVEHFITKRCDWHHGCLWNRDTGRRVTAIMPVHILGHPVHLDPILNIARKFGLKVIEDAAEALGAEYRGQRIGTHGDVACFSFNGNKIMTTGGGGMLVTNDSSLAERARYLTTQAKDDPIEYIHGEVGYNYRMPNLLAAVGVAQLERLDAFIMRKREIAAAYHEYLSTLPGIEMHSESPVARSTYWLSTVRIDAEAVGMTAVELRDSLSAAGVQTRRLWQPIHQSPAHSGASAVLSGIADAIAESALSLPSTPTLTDRSIPQIVSRIRSACESRSKAA